MARLAESHPKNGASLPQLQHRYVMPLLRVLLAFASFTCAVRPVQLGWSTATYVRGCSGSGGFGFLRTADEPVVRQLSPLPAEQLPEVGSHME
eukprot:3765650-Amphidinium_carterae.1